MRALSVEQELVLLRDQIAKIRAAGCPETYRLPERGWLLVYEALVRVTATNRDAGVQTGRKRVREYRRAEPGHSSSATT